MKTEDVRKILRGKCISDESCEAAISELLVLFNVSDTEGKCLHTFKREHRHGYPYRPFVCTECGYEP